MRLLDSPVAKGLLNEMKFRCIGPTRGGRCVAVAGHPDNPAVAASAAFTSLASCFATL